MHKAFPHIESGAGYIQLSRLPFNQSIKLRNWLPETSMITVKADGFIADDCIQYSEYEYWFDFQFRQEAEPDYGI
jgi:hypothetical protein